MRVETSPVPVPAARPDFTVMRSGVGSPIIIQSGFSTDRSMYGELARTISRGTGRPVWGVNTPWLTADAIPRESALLERVVRAASERDLATGGDGKVSIVGHSKGGLIARHLLQRGGDALVDQLVTLGTPHHGFEIINSSLSRALMQLTPIAGIRDLMRGSKIVNELNAGLPAFMDRALAANPKFHLTAIAGDTLTGSDLLITTAAARLPGHVPGITQKVVRGTGANHAAVGGMWGVMHTRAGAELVSALRSR